MSSNIYLPPRNCRSYAGLPGSPCVRSKAHMGVEMLIFLAVLGIALTIGITYAVCRAIEGSLHVPTDAEIKSRTRVKPPTYPY